MGTTSALVVLAVVAACSSSAATPEQRLATYLEHGGVATRLDRATFDQIVVEPFRGLYDDYAAQPAPVLEGPLEIRRHFAGDPKLTPAQTRLRWALPAMYPAYVARGNVFVEAHGHWFTLAGLDEALLARVAALDPACAARLALSGPRGACTDMGWMIADAALRADRQRFARGCELAKPQCQLRGIAAIDDVVHDLALVRNSAATTNSAAIESVACTKAEYTVQDEFGGFVMLRDKGCHTCTFAPENDGSAIVEQYAHGLRDEPASFLAAAGLHELSLCSSIRQRSANNDVEVGGTIDPQHGGMFLLTGTVDLSGEEIVAHELFHLFDRHPKMLKYARYDSEWPTDGGYVNEYAKTSIREDHATVYQYMMARPDRLCAEAATDPLIAKKARIIRDRIASVIGDVGYLDERLPCLR